MERLSHLKRSNLGEKNLYVNITQDIRVNIWNNIRSYRLKFLHLLQVFLNIALKQMENVYIWKRVLGSVYSSFDFQFWFVLTINMQGRKE